MEILYEDFKDMEELLPEVITIESHSYNLNTVFRTYGAIRVMEEAYDSSSLTKEEKIETLTRESANINKLVDFEIIELTTEAALGDALKKIWTIIKKALKDFGRFMKKFWIKALKLVRKLIGKKNVERIERFVFFLTSVPLIPIAIMGYGIYLEYLKVKGPSDDVKDLVFTEKGMVEEYRNRFIKRYGEESTRSLEERVAAALTIKGEVKAKLGYLRLKVSPNKIVVSHTILLDSEKENELFSFKGDPEEILAEYFKDKDLTDPKIYPMVHKINHTLAYRWFSEEGKGVNVNKAIVHSSITMKEIFDKIHHNLKTVTKSLSQLKTPEGIVVHHQSMKIDPKFMLCGVDEEYSSEGLEKSLLDKDQEYKEIVFQPLRIKEILNALLRKSQDKKDAYGKLVEDYVNIISKEVEVMYVELTRLTNVVDKEDAGDEVILAMKHLKELTDAINKGSVEFIKTLKYITDLQDEFLEFMRKPGNKI